MKKIAVYGDSFANCNSEIALKDEKTWVDLLGKHYQVDNYAQSGSSLYFSYCRFQDTHSRYDRLIFIVTSPGRLEVLNHDDQTIYISNLESAEYHLPRSGPLNRPYVLAARDYFKYIYNDEKENFIHRLILSEITRIRPDTFIYPAFAEDQTEFTLSEISRIERGAWECLGGTYDPRQDRRRAHITDDNHRKVYEHIYQDLTVYYKQTTLNSQQFKSRFTHNELVRFFTK